MEGSWPVRGALCSDQVRFFEGVTAEWRSRSRGRRVTSQGRKGVLYGNKVEKQYCSQKTGTRPQWRLLKKGLQFVGVANKAAGVQRGTKKARTPLCKCGCLFTVNHLDAFRLQPTCYSSFRLRLLLSHATRPFDISRRVGGAAARRASLARDVNVAVYLRSTNSMG